ncbi:MAG: DEAD/DEAH box helicase [Acidimicrobiales bacterium]|nr:DEAD/DEAH box helicase [Acidimicrobiales bacterium]
MNFAPGSLVRARNREWTVLPESTDELVIVRPLGGSNDEETGILTALETVEPATFDLPRPDQLGDFRSARMLRDALKLGFRSSAGPFRSIAKIAVTPRPYQLVPLLMALKLDPVRLLIADDVGIGKTIESALIAKELLEQGSAHQSCVLCPPHLAEQWQAELKDKFHIDAELVLSSTASRLERRLAHDQSIFDVYNHTVVSIDFIKSDRRRDDFIRACPELVIVDEAHACADSAEGSGARHQRFQLVRDLAANSDRHLILVTATPHSGKEGSFRSLLSLVDARFEELPDTLAGEQHRPLREELARHLVQRRRGDIRHYLEVDTQFPNRTETEATYTLSNPYRRLFTEVLTFARSTVRTTDGHRQRVRWWSALGLLRALASSPAAAAATMRTRAATAETASAEEADLIGRQTILDLDEAEEGIDVVPGSDSEASSDSPVTRRLRQFANTADTLDGDDDQKLLDAVALVKQLLADGFNPIVFCRFIETAEYVARHFRNRLPSRLDVSVEAVTGRIPPADREARVKALGDCPRRVLVATDCLSEGINLQDHFSAVMHYDLPWNPTRLEQREGRVDRFGQQATEVRVVTFYGADNQIDQTVHDVLLRKHVAIRKALGVSIPVPGSTADVIEALAESVLTRSDLSIEDRLPGLEEFLRPSTERLHLQWDDAEERERQSRSIFAQHTINPDEVGEELVALQTAVGSGADVEQFVRTSVAAYGGIATPDSPTVLELSDTPLALRDALGLPGDQASMRAAFDMPAGDGVVYLSRTTPLVEGLAGHLLNEALDPLLDCPAARAGVIETDAVARKTTLFLCRFRINLSAEGRTGHVSMLAEEAVTMAFTGDMMWPEWIDEASAEALLHAQPTANVDEGVQRHTIEEVLAAESIWRSVITAAAQRRADELVAAHTRVRQAAGRRGGMLARYRAEALLPADVLGIFVYLPELKP